MSNDGSKNNPSQSQPNVSDQATGNDPSLVDLVDALDSVDTSAPETSLNPTSIDDNNEGRIELDEDSQKVIKK